MISIEKISEVHLRVYTDSSIAQELSDFFTFEVPGARFTPAYKNRIWDGKIRMYDLHRKTLYVGLLKYVLDFAERNEYEVEYIRADLVAAPSSGVMAMSEIDLDDDTRDGILFRLWIKAGSYPGGWPGRLMELFHEHGPKNGDNLQPRHYRAALMALAKEKGINLP